MDLNHLFSSVEGFDWDRGNRSKSRLKHGVEPAESEEAFFQQPLLILEDKVHSGVEPRFRLLGRTAGGKKLFAALTIRNGKVRVISVRPQSRQERRIYEKA